MKNRGSEIADIVNGIKKSRRESIARAITLAENEETLFPDVIKRIYRKNMQTRVIGITGAPGCGKSSLISFIGPKLMAAGHRVAIIAVDASSPFTGGSFLGNRIRMQESLEKSGIFMRSMSSRGSRGGLSMSITNAIIVLSSAGFDRIIIEPVGSGQSDTDIMDITSTIVVVLSPGFGDEIQAAKAGLMELADIFVMNKTDMPDVDRAERDFRYYLSTVPPDKMVHEIIKTNAISGEGTDELVRSIENHEKGVDQTAFYKKIFETEVLRIAKDMVAVELEEIARAKSEWIKRLSTSGLDPYSAADKLLNQINNQS